MVSILFFFLGTYEKGNIDDVTYALCPNLICLFYVGSPIILYHDSIVS